MKRILFVCFQTAFHLKLDPDSTAGCFNSKMDQILWLDLLVAARRSCQQKIDQVGILHGVEQRRFLRRNATRLLESYALTVIAVISSAGTYTEVPEMESRGYRRCFF